MASRSSTVSSMWKQWGRDGPKQGRDKWGNLRTQAKAVSGEAAVERRWGRRGHAERRGGEGQARRSQGTEGRRPRPTHTRGRCPPLKIHHQPGLGSAKEMAMEGIGKIEQGSSSSTSSSSTSTSSRTHSQG